MKNCLHPNVTLTLTFLLLLTCQASGQGTPELLYYRFNGSGTSIPNMASNPPTGTSVATISGSMTQGGTGTCGGTALVGTGATSTTDYVSTGWATSLSGSWTISFWTNNIPSTTTTYYIFGDINAASFRCFTGGVAGAGNWILRGGFTDVTATGGASTGPAVTTFVYNASAGYIYAYVNGTQVSAVAQSTITISGSGPFKVGSYGATNGLPSTSLMDEFRFYSRALTPTEVSRLTYTGNTSSNLTLTGCAGGFKSPSGKYTWNTPGTYQDTMNNSNGCDSVMTCSVSFSNTTYDTITRNTCNSFTGPSGKYTWFTSGTYKDTIVNSSGCDSVITVNLTIRYKTTSTLTVALCASSYLSPGGTKTWTSSGVYKDTIVNSVGCDSIITVNLALNLPTSSTISPSVCNSYKSPSGKYTWTGSGTYQDTIPNAVGCDSVMTINLVVRVSTAATVSITACNSYISPSGKHNWTISGTYQDTILNAAGCDSMMTINLTIRQSTSSSITPLACQKYISPSGKYTWVFNGTYKDTIPNVAGCDSVITVNLVIRFFSSRTISPKVCNSYTSPSGKYTWTISGTYKDTIPNAAGCDSLITINLTVNNSSSAVVNVMACNSYVSPSGRYVWNVAGVYKDTIPTKGGCDSVLIINLTIQTVNVSVTQQGALLTANAAGATYQWLNCSNGFAPISGQTGQSFTALANGSYAVLVTAACADTSACYNVVTAGRKAIDFAESLLVYPNPGRGDISIAAATGLKNATVALMNITGQTIWQKTNLSGTQIELSLPPLPDSMYFIEISDGANTARLKLLRY